MSTISNAALAVGIGAGVGGAVSAGLTLYAANGTSQPSMLAGTLANTQATPYGVLFDSALAVGLLTKTPLRQLGAVTRIGAGIGLVGGLLGGFYVGRGLDHLLNRDWYRDSKRLAEQDVDAARSYFVDHGIDQHGATDDIPIAVDRSLYNAYFNPQDWHGQKIVIGRYPDGTSFATSKDVLYHEYSHRIIDHFAPGMQNQPGQGGAIGEALADTFACAIDADDWTVGEGGSGEPIRSLENPKSIDTGIAGTQYPETRAEYVRTDDDSGGVHLNSTIVSHTNYVIGSQIGRERMAEIYIHALTSGYLGASTSFADLAGIAVRSAGELYGDGSRPKRAVEQAWRDAGYL